MIWRKIVADIRGGNLKNHKLFILKFAIVGVCVIIAALAIAFFLLKHGNAETEMILTETVDDIDMEDIANAVTDIETDTGAGTEITQTDAGAVEHVQDEALLKELSWDDCKDVMDNAVFHFTFTDGTVVDMEVEYGHIVEEVEYRDITGDGIDEVIAFLHFVNTVTEYTVIWIYQVDNGTVTDISPQTQIEGLADIPCNMELVTDYAQEYPLALHLEYYDKKPGFSYVDGAVTVGYKNGRWENVGANRKPTNTSASVTSTEQKLLAITQNAAGCELEAYVYVDMDCDGLEELIGVCHDDENIYHTWYCSSDGEACLKLHQNDSWMDTCVIELLEYGNGAHVVINAYCFIGNQKNYTIIALRDGAASCLVSNSYGYVYMTQEGDIILVAEDYDAEYESDIGMMGHTWKDTYLYYDGEAYREYGATEITEDEYLQYENAQALKDMIADRVSGYYTETLKFSYFVRKNNLLHIQCNDCSVYGSIEYGYYTVRIHGNALDERLGEYTAGMMAPSFSDLEVTY